MIKLNNKILLFNENIDKYKFEIIPHKNCYVTHLIISHTI